VEQNALHPAQRYFYKDARATQIHTNQDFYAYIEQAKTVLINFPVLYIERICSTKLRQFSTFNSMCQITPFQHVLTSFDDFVSPEFREKYT
jgi:hypothetical protein